MFILRRHNCRLRLPRLYVIDSLNMFSINRNNEGLSRRIIFALAFAALFLSSQIFAVEHALEAEHAAHSECSVCQLNKHFQYLVASDGYIPLTFAPALAEPVNLVVAYRLGLSYSLFQPRAPPQSAN